MNAAAGDFWARLPLGPGVRLLNHDAHGVAALLKPAGILSHPNTARDEARSLLAGPYEAGHECFVWRGPDGAEGRLWLLNRLDSATSGVILVAADDTVARVIKALFARKQVRKVYEALVFGRPTEPVQLWRDRLAVRKGGGGIRTSTAGNLEAAARCTVLRRGRGRPPLALLRLEPRTGRSHQLRVQCARRGLPIVGDQTYGDFRLNREFARGTGWKRLFLHSAETEFRYALEGRSTLFAAKAPTPPEFTAAMDAD